MHFDVLIVGAGPAGCSAAYTLRTAGVTVALVDKHAFPRIKPCAGALTIKAVKAIPFSIAPVVRHVCYEFQAGLRTERTTAFSGKYPIAVMTVRSEFDAFFLGRCLEKGVMYERIASTFALAREGLSWLLKTPDQTFRARFLIGADGANSRVRQLLRLAPDLRFGFAVETCVPTRCPAKSPMQLDFGVVGNGYGWVFPKDNHVNIGLYTLDHTIKHAMSRLSDYCRVKTGSGLAGDLHGARIAYGGQTFRHTSGSAFLVGDAAGLIDPLIGEGIYNAIRSGQLAAQAITDVLTRGVDTYGTRIREITSDLASYAFDTRMFYGRIERGYRHLVLPPIRYALMKGYALGWPIKSIKRRFLLLPFSRPKLGDVPTLHELHGR